MGFRTCLARGVVRLGRPLNKWRDVFVFHLINRGTYGDGAERFDESIELACHVDQGARLWGDGGRCEWCPPPPNTEVTPLGRLRPL